MRRYIWYFIFFIASLIFELSIEKSTAQQEAQFKLAATQGYGSTQNQSSSETSFLMGYKYYEKDEVFLKYKQQTRSYLSGTHFQDQLWSLSHSIKLSDQYYLESSVSFSPSAEFLPKKQYELEAHYLFAQAYDLSLGLKTSLYRNATTITFMPSLLREFEKNRILQIKSFLTLGDSSPVLSTMLAFTFHPIQSLRLRNDLSFGNSYEDRNLHDPFWSWGLLAGQSITKQFEVFVQVTIYRGKLRKEKMALLGVECQF